MKIAMTYVTQHSTPKRVAITPTRRALSWAVFCLLAGTLSTPLYSQNLTFTNQDIPSGTYQATGTITADAGNGSTATTISNGASVIFQAGTRIVLSPNFHAFPGSSFQASIGLSGSSFTIYGKVTAPSGCGIPGVTVNLSGSQNGSTKTDGTGAYAFTVGNETGSYTLTPSQPPWVFNYSSFSVTNTNPIANFQVTSPPIPAREYIRLGGRIVAVANCGAQ
jgi:hypothetical protein